MASTEPKPEANDKLFNDSDEEFKASAVSPDMVAQYDDFSDDDEEIAFGTTVNDNDYMHQYKKRNHITSTINSLLSPNAARAELHSHSTKPSHHVTFSPTTLENARTMTDNSTVNAMAQGITIIHHHFYHHQFYNMLVHFCI